MLKREMPNFQSVAAGWRAIEVKKKKQSPPSSSSRRGIIIISFKSQFVASLHKRGDGRTDGRGERGTDAEREKDAENAPLLTDEDGRAAGAQALGGRRTTKRMRR